MSVSPHTQTSRKTKLNIDPARRLNQWLAHRELMRDIQRWGICRAVSKQPARAGTASKHFQEQFNSDGDEQGRIYQWRCITGSCAHHMAQGHGRDRTGEQESGGRCLASIVQRAVTEGRHASSAPLFAQTVAGCRLG
jgi:hypothetical protein